MQEVESGSCEHSGSGVRAGDQESEGVCCEVFDGWGELSFFFIRVEGGIEDASWAVLPRDPRLEVCDSVVTLLQKVTVSVRLIPSAK